MIVMSVFLSLSLLFSKEIWAQTNDNVPLEINHWDCGTNCSATLYDNGLLKISATAQTGEMKAYGTPARSSNASLGRLTTAPWADYEDNILSIEVADGITNVGYGAFTGLQSVTNVNISDTVETIGGSAFADQKALTTVHLGNKVSTLGGYAFGATIALTSINLPDSLSTIGDHALYATHVPVYEIPDSVTKIHPEAFAGIRSPSKIYCNNVNNRCRQISSPRLVAYEKSGNRYVLDGVHYKSLSDMKNGIPVKRIYTVDEANEVSGFSNRVSISYH